MVVTLARKLLEGSQDFPYNFCIFNFLLKIECGNTYLIKSPIEWVKQLIFTSINQEMSIFNLVSLTFLVLS